MSFNCKSKIHFLLIIILFAFLFISTPLQVEKSIKVTISNNNLEIYQSFLSEKNKRAEDITDLKSEFGNRNVADLIIIKQALNSAGLPVEFDFYTTPNTARSINLVMDGSAVLVHQDIFSMAFNNKVFMSSPIVRRGEFIKGLYGLKTNEQLMRVKTLEDISKLSAVCSDKWRVDWRTLKKLKPRLLINAPRYGHFFNVIKFRKIDFTLLEFQQDVSKPIRYNDIELVAVPGIKIALDDSRHFMISKKHPDGTLIFEALEEGIGILRQKGLIKKYLEDVKFLRNDLSHWKLIK